MKNNKKKGGSLASDYVFKLGNTKCLKGGKKTKSVKSKKSKSVKSKKVKSKKSKSVKSKKVKSKTIKGGGSDWAHTLYSRGPINVPSTYNEQMFRLFNKTGKFYSSQGKLNEINM